MQNICGKQCKLRPLAMADKELSIRWRSNTELRKLTLGYRFPITEAMEEQWYDQVLNDQSQKRLYFAIEVLDPVVTVGMVHFTGIDWISRRAEFGILIGDTAWHAKGLGKEASSLLIDYGFNVLNLRKISLRVPMYNTPAVSLYEKLGFEKEGVLRQEVFYDDQYHDVMLMSIIKTN